MKTTTTGAAAGAAVLDDLRAALESRTPEADGWAAARQQGGDTAAIIGALVLKERFTRWHAAATAAVLAGLVALRV